MVIKRPLLHYLGPSFLTLQRKLSWKHHTVTVNDNIYTWFPHKCQKIAHYLINKKKQISLATLSLKITDIREHEACDLATNMPLCNRINRPYLSSQKFFWLACMLSGQTGFTKCFRWLTFVSTVLNTAFQGRPQPKLLHTAHTKVTSLETKTLTALFKIKLPVPPCNLYYQEKPHII